MEAQVWVEERQRLEQTLEVVGSELQKTEASFGIVDGNDRLINVQDDGSDDAVVQQFVIREKLRTLHQLRLSRGQPYFARLDFTPDPGAPVYGNMKSGRNDAIYVGRWGVIQTPEYKIWVADWRSPVANLYYSGQIGRVSYEAPDGKVEGEMTLKRMFSIDKGQLENMQDTGLVGQEKFLTDALSQVTTARLREVVTTIQAEQNNVIRYDPHLPLCVQGVAGSGKTTIALHRIAWILYRLQKELLPQQLLILAPNPLFLSYISRVLPDLGVDDVRQTTFEGLCAQLLGKKHMPKLLQSERLRERLTLSKPQRDALDNVLRLKGALSLRDELERFLARWEESCIPANDVLLGNTTIITAEEMRRYFLTEFRHFPLEGRKDEVRKVVAIRLKKALDKAGEMLGKAVEERLDKLLRSMPDGEERRARAKALFDSRDERLNQLKERKLSFLKAFDSLWGSMELLEVYAAFWRELAERKEQYLPVMEQTLPLLQKKRAASEDLPALLVLARGLYGTPRLTVKHVVIDEAQDVSPLQIKVLRELFNRDAFTLVGDLCQGIYGDEGLRSWEDVGQGVFSKPPMVTHLSTAYRSTMEIMNVAFSVMKRHPVAGAGQAKPVLRHGQRPRLSAVKSRAEWLQTIQGIVEGWLSEGFQGIAIVVKTDKAANDLYRALHAALPQAKRVGLGDDVFAGGVQMMDASVVKGLEFDCVLIADADERTYPDERFYAKLFYVLCTRSLHRLAFLYEGSPTRHLENAPLE
ncbi:MAG: AAA family ATPase [Eubacteriales bacterium]|nr:AAA family ATPase [Eubacteriales bacterium]